MYTGALLEAYNALANRQFGDELRMYDKMRKDDPNKKYECIVGAEEQVLLDKYNQEAQKEFQKIRLDFRKPEVDVIILSRCESQKYYNMTCETIRSLRLSSPEICFRILVVESEPEFQKFLYHPWPWFESSCFVHPREEFKYNRFLNIGNNYLLNSNEPTRNPYLLVLNNDITSFCPGFVNKLISGLHAHDAAFGIDFRDAFRLGVEKNSHLLTDWNYNRYFGWCFMVKRSLFDLHPFSKFFPEDILFYNQDVYFVKMLESLGMHHVCDLSARAWHLQHASHCLRSDMIKQTCEAAEFAGGQLKHLEISSSDHAPHQIANQEALTVTPDLKNFLRDNT